ncbi:hypothetical protein [Enterococcus phage Toszka]
MAKGLEAIAQAAQTQSKGSGEQSKKTYLKKGQSIRARIPEDILENLHVNQVVSVFEPQVLPTLSYHAEGRTDVRDLYHEATEIMLADHRAKVESGEIERGTQDDKDSYRAARILTPKPLILFGIIPLADFTQGTKKTNTYPAGEPILLETNLGRDNANIDALTNFLSKETNAKKFPKKAFEITCEAANRYTFTPLDDDDLTPEELEVFKATEGATVPEEDFENAIFESTIERQIEDLKKIGFDTTRLPNLPTAAPAATNNGADEVGTVDPSGIDF